VVIFYIIKFENLNLPDNDKYQHINFLTIDYREFLGGLFKKYSPKLIMYDKSHFIILIPMLHLIHNDIY